MTAKNRKKDTHRSFDLWTFHGVRCVCGLLIGSWIFLMFRGVSRSRLDVGFLTMYIGVYFCIDRLRFPRDYVGCASPPQRLTELERRADDRSEQETDSRHGVVSAGAVRFATFVRTCVRVFRNTDGLAVGTVCRHHRPPAQWRKRGTGGRQRPSRKSRFSFTRTARNPAWRDGHSARTTAMNRHYRIRKKSRLPAAKVVRDPAWKVEHPTALPGARSRQGDEPK